MSMKKLYTKRTRVRKKEIVLFHLGGAVPRWNLGISHCSRANKGAAGIASSACISGSIFSCNERGSTKNREKCRARHYIIPSRTFLISSYSLQVQAHARPLEILEISRSTRSSTLIFLSDEKQFDLGFEQKMCAATTPR